MNNKFKRNEILLDLTSLLDVIFIILMIVLSKSVASKSDYEAEVKEELEAEYEVSMDEYAKLNTQLEDAKNQYEAALKNMKSSFEHVEYISIYCTFDEEKPENRTITLMVASNQFDNNDSENPVYHLEGFNTDEFENFKNDLAAIVSNNPQKKIFISLNDNGEEILYRDHVDISQFVSGLTGDIVSINID